MASPTWCTWVWVNSRSWWWTGRPAWHAAIHGVAKSRTQLSDWSDLKVSLGEGSGNPLQYSCLENSMDRGAWQVTARGAAKSWPWQHTQGVRVLCIDICHCCSVAKSCPWTTAHQPSLTFTIFWSLLKLMSTESVMPSNHLILCHTISSCPQSFPASGSFPVSQLFASSGQIIESITSILPMNIQGWFPLGLTGLISMLSKGLSRVFSSTTVWKHQFFKHDVKQSTPKHHSSYNFWSLRIQKQSCWVVLGQEHPQC